MPISTDSVTAAAGQQPLATVCNEDALNEFLDSAAFRAEFGFPPPSDELCEVALLGRVEDEEFLDAPAPQDAAGREAAMRSVVATRMFPICFTFQHNEAIARRAEEMRGQGDGGARRQRRAARLARFFGAAAAALLLRVRKITASSKGGKEEEEGTPKDAVADAVTLFSVMFEETSWVAQSGLPPHRALRPCRLLSKAVAALLDSFTDPELGLLGRSRVMLRSAVQAQVRAAAATAAAAAAATAEGDSDAGGRKQKGLQPRSAKRRRDDE